MILINIPKNKWVDHFSRIARPLHRFTDRIPFITGHNNIDKNFAVILSLTYPLHPKLQNVGKTSFCDCKPLISVKIPPSIHFFLNEAFIDLSSFHLL